MNDYKNDYKTVFVPAELVKSSMGLVFKPNGDQLARDIQATITEQIDYGYKVFSMSAINETHNNYTHTSGVIIIFELII